MLMCGPGGRGVRCPRCPSRVPGKLAGTLGAALPAARGCGSPVLLSLGAAALSCWSEGGSKPGCRHVVPRETLWLGQGPCAGLQSTDDQVGGRGGDRQQHMAGLVGRAGLGQLAVGLGPRISWLGCWDPCTSPSAEAQEAGLWGTSCLGLAGLSVQEWGPAQLR